MANFLKKTVAEAVISELQDAVKEHMKSFVHMFSSSFYIFWYPEFSLRNLKDANSFTFHDVL